MSRDLTRPFGVLTMMVTMLLGMNGRLEAGVFAPRGAMCVAAAGQAGAALRPCSPSAAPQSCCAG